MSTRPTLATWGKGLALIAFAVLLTAIPARYIYARWRGALIAGPASYDAPPTVMREQTSRISAEEHYFLLQPGNESLLEEYRRIKELSGEEGIRARTELKVRLGNSRTR